MPTQLHLMETIRWPFGFVPREKKYYFFLNHWVGTWSHLKDTIEWPLGCVPKAQLGAHTIVYLRGKNLFRKIQLGGHHIAPLKIIGCPPGYVFKAQLSAHPIFVIRKKQNSFKKKS